MTELTVMGLRAGRLLWREIKLVRKTTDVPWTNIYAPLPKGTIQYLIIALNRKRMTECVMLHNIYWIKSKIAMDVD